MTKRLRSRRNAALSAAAALAVTIPLFAAATGSADAAPAATGITPLWTASVGGAVTSGPTGGAASVVLASTGGALTALDTATGATAFRSQLGSVALASRAVADATAFYVEGAKCTVTAVSQKTGAQLWSRQVSSSCDLQRGGLSVSGGVVLATTTTGGLHALDAATGTPKWTVTGGGAQTFGSPVVAGGVVYTGWDSHRLTAVSLATGATVFSRTLAGFVRSTPNVSGGLVYVGDDTGTFYALDAKTGAVAWKTAPAASTTKPLARSRPVVAGGLVLVTVAEQQGWTGSVVALNATSGAVVWRSAVGYSEAGVAVSNGVVYVATGAKKLYALTLATGAIQSASTTTLPATPVGAPLVAGTRLLVAGKAGSVQAFSITGSPTTTPTATATPTATPSTSAASSPSGMVMPVGNQTGWTQAFTDDFTGTAVNTKKWSLYNGVPGAYPRTTWRPKNAIVSNGYVNLAAYYDSSVGKWTSAGMTSGKGLTQMYGKWEVRMRTDKAAGIGLALLLWPTKGWPPEIDFAEDDNGLRSKLTATMHYGSSNTMIHNSTALNMTTWHTYGVVWTPSKLQYTVDGKVWATVASANVPKQAMLLDMQTQTDGCQTAGHCTVAGQTMADTDVDWVVGYKYTP